MNKERFEDIMSAITFAEAGEHASAIEFIKGKGRVLIAISEKVFDRNVLTYALSICRRIKADIEILYLARLGSEPPDLTEFMAAAGKEGIRSSLIRKEGCMKKAILDHTGKRSEILFVVVGSTPELDMECSAGEKTLSEAWKRLTCPLVVVSKGGLPSTA